MRKIVMLTVIVMSIMLLVNLASAEDFEGWDEIRPALKDGDGAEFVVDTDYDIEFTSAGANEFGQVLAAANWVADNMEYEPDPDDPGDVWTASDQQFEEITNGGGTGDCEDFSILLCALMRFVIGIPANRVWVQGGILSVPGGKPKVIPPIFGHAYIVYKAEKRGIFYIEPQWGGYPYRGSFPSITHWDTTPPVLAGESAMLRFNDEWVKGGGFWLAGPKEK
ncbi:hypothetical protein ES705_12968 [subsurface metagenome]